MQIGLVTPISIFSGTVGWRLRSSPHKVAKRMWLCENSDDDTQSANWLTGHSQPFALVRQMTVVLNEHAGSKALIGHRVSNHGVHKRTNTQIQWRATCWPVAT